MNHFTNRAGFKAISANQPWHFRAAQPPGGHPTGAYFTTLEPGTRHLASRLGIPKEKTGYVLSFVDIDDLLPLRGGRGDYVFYSPIDYDVAHERQLYAGVSCK